MVHKFEDRENVQEETWLQDYFEGRHLCDKNIIELDFRRRFVRLLGYGFHTIESPLALSILHNYNISLKADESGDY